MQQLETIQRIAISLDCHRDSPAVTYPLIDKLCELVGVTHENSQSRTGTDTAQGSGETTGSQSTDGSQVCRQREAEVVETTEPSLR